MLSITNLSKSFKNYKALDGLNLEIDDNEIFGFVGPNGAGKTTTMRIIAGLLAPDSGVVTIDGCNVVREKEKIRKKIGYMPDFFGAYEYMKAHEYMEYFASLYGIEGKKASIRCDELLELVGLYDRRDTYVDDMSRGMKQKMCLARCLIHNPKLLILDEPASGLDPRARFELKGIMMSLKDMGKTVIISSHILPELAMLTTTVGIIQNGKMITKGPIDEILGSLNKEVRLTIKYYGEFDKAVVMLKKNDKVSELIIEENSTTFVFDGSEKERAQLIGEMCKEGLQVLEVVVNKENLEQLFLEITKENDEIRKV